MPIKRKNNVFASVDWMTIILWLTMMLLGWVSIYAAVYNEEHHSIFDFSQRYGKQLIWILAALLIAFVVLMIEDDFFRFFAYVIYAGSIVLLILVLIVGKEINGAKSWFSLGPIQVQPSEFAKYGTALVLARFLSDNPARKTKYLYLKAILFLLAPFGLIALQPDFGSVLVYVSFIILLYREGIPPYIPVVGIMGAILFISSLILDNYVMLISLYVVTSIIFAINSKSVKYAIVLIGSFVIVHFLSLKVLDIFKIEVEDFMVLMADLALILLFFNLRNIKKKVPYTLLFSFIFIASFGLTQSVDYVFDEFLEPHQQKRINVLLGLEDDPKGAGYNVMQSKIAIGSGGLAGKGFLKGTQTKYKFVPEQSTDFIFCTVGEEWGFLGTAAVVLLFTFFIMRLVNIAERQRIKFNRVYGYAVVGIITFHFMVNIGMTIGLFPVIGIPLPFFSYGGSSLWSFTVLVFTMLKLDAMRMDKLGR
ncbi:rod shape-determining protein RodA [Bacteroidales bacterium]|nr:rod shape-determining protein RodA [Bacteroidales bacterium]